MKSGLYPSLPDNDILSNALKLARSNNCEQYFCKKSSNFPLIVGKYFAYDVESFALIFDAKENYLQMNFNRKYLVQINLELAKIKEYHEFKFDKSTIHDLIISINKFFFSFLTKGTTNYFEMNTNDDHNQRLLYYLYYLCSKLLIYISLSPNFCYEHTLIDEWNHFFNNFSIIKKAVKNLEKKNTQSIDLKKDINVNNYNTNNISIKYNNNKNQHISMFEELKNSVLEYSMIINNYQNFLTLLLFQIGDDEDPIPNRKNLELLEKFMKIFKLFYQLNEKFKIIGFKDFYSESVSKYLNLKEECKIYFKIITGKCEESKPFCLIKYHWLFDSAAKSDILYIFNYHKQRTEMINSINSLNLQMNNMFLFLEVRRNNIIEDTLNFIANSQINIKKPLKVRFHSELGIDEGGVKKEFFMLLIRKLFDPLYAMFTFNEKSRFFWFNSITFESKIKFELIGVILGLAFFNNVILDVKFPQVIYKKLLGLETSLDDLREIDSELFSNLKYLLNTKETDLKDKLMTTFTVIVDHFGEKIVVPLKDNGENIFIDEFNKEEYVLLYLNWYFNISIEHLFNPFRLGFYRVCDDKLFHMLRPEELELIICGTQCLDFKELEKATRYDDGYEKDSLTMKFFWEVIHSLSSEDQKKFLFFLTGCDRAPINGLGSLVITISRFGPDSDKLPCAHTCFNHLLLPDYQNKDKLRDRLLIAINNAEGFGLM